VLLVDKTEPGSTSETGPDPRGTCIDDLMGWLQYSLILGLSIENHHILYIILEYLAGLLPTSCGYGGAQAWKPARAAWVCLSSDRGRLRRLKVGQFSSVGPIAT
jgi:hypothetical protein